MTAVDGPARSPGTLALDFGALLVIVRPEHEVAVSELGGREPIACAALIAVDAVICPVAAADSEALECRSHEGNRRMERVSWRSGLRKGSFVKIQSSTSEVSRKDIRWKRGFSLLTK